MANGVEVRGKTIRVFFRYRNATCREKPDLEPTPKNIAYAERMTAQIRHEIGAGLFDYAHHFPNSARIAANTLGNYLDLWLDIKRQRVADSTFRAYASAVTHHIRPKFGNHQADRIDRLAVESWISDELAGLASKTIKEIVAILRQVYGLYRARYSATIDPTNGIRVAMPDDDDPDPFTRNEIDRILHAKPHGGRLQEFNTIRFMLWSGPRVSEALALAWEDVESVSVKQRDNRTIKAERVRFVFLNTYTGRPHYATFVSGKRSSSPTSNTPVSGFVVPDSAGTPISVRC